MCCERETGALIRACGYRLTPQRLLIVSALRHAPGPLSAGELAHAIANGYPLINASTVGRTLALLCNLGLAAETLLGNQRVAYAWLPDAACHYLVCTHCGVTTAVADDLGGALTAILWPRNGFVAQAALLAIPGRCQACSEQQPPALNSSVLTKESPADARELLDPPSQPARLSARRGSRRRTGRARPGARRLR